MNPVDSLNHQPCRRLCCLPASWVSLILIDVALIAFAMTSRLPLSAQQTEPADQSWTIIQIDGPADAPADSTRFEALDVFVDSGDQLLAAWQLELVGDTPGIQIVGIEGGEHPAFRNPPYYDTRAMNNNRVILASFETGDNLPTGRSRVARIHVLVSGTGLCEYRTRLTASATRDGLRIPATISVARTGA